jgi:CubicO group peptidase (beta-lactamase class C family)
VCVCCDVGLRLIISAARIACSPRWPDSIACLWYDLANTAWRSEPGFESGAGGLVSTIHDYFAFIEMMLNKGRGREQILSRASVELMTVDKLTPAQRGGSEIFFGAHSSWGFGMAVDIRRSEIFHTPGRFGWTGRLRHNGLTPILQRG